MTPKLAPRFAINERLSGFLRGLWRTCSLPSPEGLAGLVSSQIMVNVAIVKAYKSHRALLILCREGYGEDATILLRALFELALDIEHVARGPLGERAQRSGEYIIVERYEFLRVLQTDSLFENHRRRVAAGEVPNWEDTMREIQDVARWAQGRWGLWNVDNAGRWTTPGKWHGRSIRQAARHIGRESHYNTIYYLTSVSARSSVRTDDCYVTVGESGGATMSTLAGPNMVSLAPTSGLEYFAWVAQNWCVLVVANDSARDGLAAIRRDSEGLMGSRRDAKRGG
jgi:hypothetical protein